ncbi:putative efflux protein, MATE family [Eubacterium ruminantium]|uniref:Multidrug export protein MepA n=1 Tax=Eubacterium ruminantium TaxID=42322 RepID=A0A1T4KGJ8_9FIRM|nr:MULTISPECIES: MATE family efflux transporter [Eubacterium]MCR5368695.1 MATE family efflux transporter [Eubacterium sp.]SCW31853.1 putative efflux protein, MATE family [Eubacterium ruminantium]SDM26670.1 putative efflux protein, MATE family [Eubacterium ruminantium]SJZ41473.1 putative efflux protein, MATE family [Eubacterium ruminantium]
MFKKKTVDKYTYMTETPVPKLITELAVPTIISMLITGIYNTADTYFVGRVPGEATAATAAVGLVFPLMAVIQAFGFFFGHGSGNFLSRMLGAGKKKESSEMASNGFVMALLFGITIAILGNIFMGPLVEFLASDKVDASTLAMTDDYARIILIGAPFMMCQFVINSQLRFQGSAVYAMVGLVAGAIVNIILDPILILVLKMNVTGAAIATVLGQITSFVILLIGCSKGENIRLSLKNVNINKYYIVQIINGGIPSLFRQGLAAISGSLLNHAAAEFGGTPTVSGITIVSRTMMLLISALIGFGQGFQPVCSFNYGANKKERVREGFWFCVKWGTVFLTVIAIVCYSYATNIVEFYRKDLSVVSVGEVTLRFQTIVLPLNAFIVMTNMMLQSIGKGVKASITASARNGLFFIPAIIILPKLFGLTGVEITQMVADILTFMITIPFAISELKKMKSDIMVAGLHDSDI